MREVNGLKWVDDDIECAAVLFDQVKSIYTDVIPYVTDFSMCAQAGGNCGLFPLELAKYFKQVITFEPDPQNYDALIANTKDVKNIAAVACALGQEHGEIAMEVEPGNCGASYVTDGGWIERRKLDELPFKSCGLIYLDVEGYEEFALRGAEETIKRFTPAIVVEMKDLARRYNRTDKDCADYLKSLRYVVVHKFDNDVVWRHE